METLTEKLQKLTPNELDSAAKLESYPNDSILDNYFSNLNPETKMEIISYANNSCDMLAEQQQPDHYTFHFSKSELRELGILNQETKMEIIPYANKSCDMLAEQQQPDHYIFDFSKSVIHELQKSLSSEPILRFIGYSEPIFVYEDQPDGARADNEVGTEHNKFYFSYNGDTDQVEEV